MKRTLTATIIMAYSSMSAQFTNVLISTVNDPEEVVIAVNPRNPNQVAGGANIDNAYFSANGGSTWTRLGMTCTPYNVWGDPVVVWDTTGSCYYFHLSNPDTTLPGATWIDRIVVQRSDNGGASYNTCNGFGKNGFKAQDKPWAVVDPATNAIHVTWTQFDNYGSGAASDSSVILYSRSIDKGNTWTAPARISTFAGDCIDDDNTVEGAVPACGPNGEVYVGWAGPKGLLFQRSNDGGNTWMATETVVAPCPGGWAYDVPGLIRCNGLPFTDCDRSGGPFRGNIYINYSTLVNSDGDIWIVKSGDGGDSWSAPIRVNSDPPGKLQFMSAMTVDQSTGNIYVLFYDRRNFSSGTSTDVYLAISKDGANSFTNYKINENTFKPGKSVFFGDYIGISAVNNIVRPIWMQLSDGVLSVYTALVDPVSLGVADKRADGLTGISFDPNPVVSEGHLRFNLDHSTHMTVQLIDSRGAVLKTILDSEAVTGDHDLAVSLSRFPPGAYYAVLYFDGTSRFVRIVKE